MTPRMVDRSPRVRRFSPRNRPQVDADSVGRLHLSREACEDKRSVGIRASVSQSPSSSSAVDQKAHRPQRRVHRAGAITRQKRTRTEHPSPSRGNSRQCHENPDAPCEKKSADNAAPRREEPHKCTGKHWYLPQVLERQA
jgi:hypothetical protein